MTIKKWPSGSMAEQMSNDVDITGGKVRNITDLAIADGGTGASTAETARANLGLGNVDNTADAAKNVLSATKFTTPVHISGVAFDGTEDIIVDEVTSNIIRSDWEHRGNVMYVELFSEQWTLLDSISLDVTSGVAGSSAVDVSDTTDLVEGYTYVLHSATHREAVVVQTVVSETRFTAGSVLQNSYTTGATLSRTDFTLSYGVATADNGQEYYIGELNAGANDAVKKLIIKRTNNDTKLRVYFKDDSMNATWTEASITTTTDTEHTYSLATRGLVQFKIVCEYDTDEEPVDITSITFMDDVRYTAFTTNTNYYIATDGSDTTGNGSYLKPWATLNKAFDFLNDYTLAPGIFVYVIIKDGHYDVTQRLSINHENGQQIIIKGEHSHEITFTSLQSISAAVSDNYATWTAEFAASDLDNIIVGDYLSIYKTGSDAFYPFLGCHRVTAKNTNTGTVTLSVRHANQTTPSTGLCSLNVTIHKAILDYTNVAADEVGRKYAIMFDERQTTSGLRRIEQLVLVGPSNVASASVYGILQHGQSSVWVANIGIVNWSYGVFARRDSFFVFKNANMLMDALVADVTLTKSVCISSCDIGLNIVIGTAVGADGDVLPIISGCSTALLCDAGGWFRSRPYIIGCKTYALYCTAVSYVSFWSGTIIEGTGVFGTCVVYASKGGFASIVYTAKGTNNATFSSPAVNTVGNENAYIDT